jgi:hypothetical protein
MEKNSANSREKVNNRENYQKIEITNFKEKMLLLMNNNLKIIIIIPKLNT